METGSFLSQVRVISLWFCDTGKNFLYLVNTNNLIRVYRINDDYSFPSVFHGIISIRALIELTSPVWYKSLNYNYEIRTVFCYLLLFGQNGK